jgi:hypothetical protein
MTLIYLSLVCLLAYLWVGVEYIHHPITTGGSFVLLILLEMGVAFTVE